MTAGACSPSLPSPPRRLDGREAIDAERIGTALGQRDHLLETPQPLLSVASPPRPRRSDPSGLRPAYPITIASLARRAAPVELNDPRPGHLLQLEASAAERLVSTISEPSDSGGDTPPEGCGPSWDLPAYQTFCWVPSRRRSEVSPAALLQKLCASPYTNTNCSGQPLPGWGAKRAPEPTERCPSLERRMMRVDVARGHILNSWRPIRSASGVRDGNRTAGFTLRCPAHAPFLQIPLRSIPRFGRARKA